MKNLITCFCEIIHSIAVIFWDYSKSVFSSFSSFHYIWFFSGDFLGTTDFFIVIFRPYLTLNLHKIVNSATARGMGGQEFS